jgi:hypothetical protein
VFLVTRSFSNFVMLRCCESAIIEIWSAIYQATKRAHTYGAGARGHAGLARDGTRGALRRGTEVARGAAM